MGERNYYYHCIAHIHRLLGCSICSIKATYCICFRLFIIFVERTKTKLNYFLNHNICRMQVTGGIKTHGICWFRTVKIGEHLSQKSKNCLNPLLVLRPWSHLKKVKQNPPKDFVGNKTVKTTTQNITTFSSQHDTDKGLCKDTRILFFIRIWGHPLKTNKGWKQFLTEVITYLPYFDCKLGERDDNNVYKQTKDLRVAGYCVLIVSYLTL